MASLPQHLDLHLIRILYLLLVEKNVSRVTLKLNHPQPSISASPQDRRPRLPRQPVPAEIEDYLALPHVAPSRMAPGNPGVIDAFLERQGMRRNVAVESPYFGLIPYMLMQTDLVLTTGRQFMPSINPSLPYPRSLA